MNPRKVIKFNLFKTGPDRFAFYFATGFGSGLLPKAPGTWGSLAAFIFILPLFDLPFIFQFGFWFTYFLIAIWAAARFDEIHGSQDHSSIVVDEFIGMAITLIPMHFFQTPKIFGFLIGFLCFRIFDVLKPWPIRFVDEWSHRENASKWAKGLGVILDDALAAVFAALVFAGILFIEKVWL